MVRDARIKIETKGQHDTSSSLLIMINNLLITSDSCGAGTQEETVTNNIR